MPCFYSRCPYNLDTNLEQAMDDQILRGDLKKKADELFKVANEYLEMLGEDDPVIWINGEDGDGIFFADANYASQFKGLVRGR